MINNVDSPCSVINNDNDCIDDENVPVGSSVLVVDDKCNNDVTYLGVTTNTYGDLTKNNNADLIYDIVIMRGNPMYYYGGTMRKTNFYGYYISDIHMRPVSYTHLDVYKRQVIHSACII